MTALLAVFPLLLVLAVFDHVRRVGLGTPLTLREGGRLVAAAAGVIGLVAGIAAVAVHA